MQFARALKEKGVEVKVIMFPDDSHPIDRSHICLFSHSRIFGTHFMNSSLILKTHLFGPLLKVKIIVTLNILG